MLKKIFTNVHVVVGGILFVIFLAIFLWLETPPVEALGAALALTVIAVAIEWWQNIF